MTYSSRNFLISWGTGSDERAPPRVSNRLSSAMMSLQTSTHSSQMKTVGPAISFRTSFWLLLQKEHRRTSSVFFFMAFSFQVASVSRLKPTTAASLASCSFRNDFVDNTIFLSLLRRHDVVAF